MKITKTQVKVSDLVKDYQDRDDLGVTGFGGKLQIRPNYQREFVYNDAKRNAVVNTVINGFPLNTMYWNDRGNGEYEVLDGQQRTISICRYVSGDFSMNIGGVAQFFHNLDDDIQDKILNYELEVYVCTGTQTERLEWFKVINIGGETLTDQELLNATYAGPWLSDAKLYFSKRGCSAQKLSEGYLKGNPIRQEILEKALKWIADRDKYKSIDMYMAKHQFDPDANDLWQYFQQVMAWAKMIFPKARKGITDCQEWGILYNKYHTNSYNTNIIETDIQRLIADDDVTKKSGIVQYLLSPRTEFDEKYLSIRAFTQSQKLRAYEAQNHRCPICMRNGIEVEYTIDEMQADHIVPWSKGGRTIDSNLQMLCTKCNNDKSNR